MGVSTGGGGSHQLGSPPREHCAGWSTAEFGSHRRPPLSQGLPSPDLVFSNSEWSPRPWAGQPGGFTRPPGRGSRSCASATAGSGPTRPARGQRRSAACVPGAAPWWLGSLPPAEEERRAAVSQQAGGSPAPLPQRRCTGCLRGAGDRDVGTAQCTTALHGHALVHGTPHQAASNHLSLWSPSNTLPGHQRRPLLQQKQAQQWGWPG